MPPAESTATGTPARAALVLTRTFDAPRDLVFRAWTDAGQLARWWGPHHYTNPRCEVDPRPGGAIHVEMRSPDGVVYPCDGVFRELVEPERLVFTTGLDAGDGASFEVLNTVTFEEHGPGRTKVTLRAQVLRCTPQAQWMVAGMADGWSQSLERLETAMAENAAGTIVTTRVFDAPRDIVFTMWVEPEHIRKWWGPNGFTTTIDRMQVKPGGVWEFVMHGPDGTDYPNRIVYDEIAWAERLVYAHTSKPVHRSTVTFADQGAGTRVTMRMVFESHADYDVAVNKHGAIEGAKQTFARLGDYLIELQR